MTSRCVLCDRSFNSDEILQQHKRTSSAHTYDCRSCDRHYGSKHALRQHLRDSPVHYPSFDCDDCDRSFNSEEALQKHLRDSPIHTLSFKCETCDRSFNSEEALQKHLRDSPIHTLSFKCETCDRSFNSEEALQKHLRDSPVHTLSFKCETCDRSFNSAEGLQQHLKYSRIHQLDPETPLDVFFRSFPDFDYDPSVPPATSYANLQRLEQWSRGSAASDDAWNRYQEALKSELDLWYGAENDLTAWHALCRPIGIDPLPKTCEQCEEAARRTHVNIVDLIEWGRSRSEDKVQTFRDVAELRTYTKETRKIFRNTLSQEDGNVVLRHLLRYIY